MTRRLVVLLALAAAGALGSAPAHAEEVCVTHDLRPTVYAAGIACVDADDPNLVRCGGVVRNFVYVCA